MTEKVSLSFGVCVCMWFVVKRQSRMSIVTKATVVSLVENRISKPTARPKYKKSDKIEQKAEQKDLHERKAIYF